MTDFPTIRHYTPATARDAEFDNTRDGGSDWKGSTAIAYRGLLADGDLSAVPASDKLLSMIETDLDVSGLRREIVPAVVGPFANVPAYLAGIPEAMLAFEDVESERGEITVVADMFISGSFDTAVYTRRGVALLALVRALSIVRPVRLVAICVIGDGEVQRRHGIAVELPSNPLDLAQCGFWLSHVSAVRRFVLGEIYHHDQYARTSHAFRDMTSEQAVDWVAKELKIDRNNMILSPGLVSADGAAPFKTDAGAAAWVQSQVNAALGEGNALAA